MVSFSVWLVKMAFWIFGSFDLLLAIFWKLYQLRCLDTVFSWPSLTFSDGRSADLPDSDPHGISTRYWSEIEDSHSRYFRAIDIPWERWTIAGMQCILRRGRSSKASQYVKNSRQRTENRPLGLRLLVVPFQTMWLLRITSFKFKQILSVFR